jgi:integrase
MATLFKPQYYRKDQATGARRKRKLRKWYVRSRDHDGILQTVAGYTDKEATRQMAARLERAAARRREGIVTPHDERLKRPLAEHLDDFRRYLASKGNCDEHVNRTARLVWAVLQGCGFERWADIQPSAVSEYLARRPDGVFDPEQVPDRPWLTAAEVATTLNVRVASIHRLVKRRSLPCEGKGRRKRFAREAVLAMLARRRRGAGVKTRNHYLVATKAFTRWLIKDGRAPNDPLVSLGCQNPARDVRRARRALTAEQFQRFIEATAAAKSFRGLSGPDRLVLYTLASQTGFRAKELASLTPASFALDACPPTVTVEAAYSKRRRRDVQPLRRGVGELMRGYLAGRPVREPVWPGNWLKVSAEMVKLDLETAGIAYADGDGRYFDFHALRGQFISLLAAGGVHPKVAQALARHSSITLTMDYYTHLDVLDVAGALDALPAVDGSLPCLGGIPPA